MKKCLSQSVPQMIVVLNYQVKRAIYIYIYIYIYVAISTLVYYKLTLTTLLYIFFNLLCSYGLLPHILQPTRVTENTATVIDNIFSNNLQDDMSVVICF